MKMSEWELCSCSGQMYRLEEWAWETGCVLPSANCSQPFIFLSTWEQYVWISHYLLNLVCVDHVLMKCLDVLLFRCAEDIHFTPQIFLYTHSWQVVINHGFWSRKYSMVHLECWTSCDWPTLQPCLMLQIWQALCFRALTNMMAL